MGALGGAPVVRYTERACWSRVRARWRGTHHRRRRNADTVTQRDGSREASRGGYRVASGRLLSDALQWVYGAQTVYRSSDTRKALTR